MAGLIPDDVWLEMLQKHIEDGLNAPQISRLLEKKYGIFITRQAVWHRLENSSVSGLDSLFCLTK